MKMIDDLYFSMYKFYKDRSTRLDSDASGQAGFSLALCAFLLLASLLMTSYVLFVILKFKTGELFLSGMFTGNLKIYTYTVLFIFIFSIRNLIYKRYVNSEYYVDLEIKHQKDSEAVKKKVAWLGIGFFCLPFVIMIMDFILLICFI